MTGDESETRVPGPKRRRPIRNRKTAYILSSLATLTMWAVAWLMFTYLPISPERLGLSVGCLLSGGVLGLLIFWLIATLPDKKSVRILGVALTLFVLATPWISSRIGRISYSRFGLTVYGLVPIPVLDITVNQRGVLWFRPKTHLILREEVARLLERDTEFVIIGIG